LNDEHYEDMTTEEEREPNTWYVGSWLAPVLVVSFLILWHLLAHSLIPNLPRTWQYGVTPYVPGESVFSTQQPPRGPAPKQVVLPKRRKPSAAK